MLSARLSYLSHLLMATTSGTVIQAPPPTRVHTCIYQAAALGTLVRLGELDGLHGLRHDAVVGGNDDDDKVRSQGATISHLTEGRMPRRVQKRHAGPVCRQVD